MFFSNITAFEQGHTYDVSVMTNGRGSSVGKLNSTSEAGVIGHDDTANIKPPTWNRSHLKYRCADLMNGTRNRTAVIFPYRNRGLHFKLALSPIHKHIIKQVSPVLNKKLLLTMSHREKLTFNTK